MSNITNKIGGFRKHEQLVLLAYVIRLKKKKTKSMF